MSSKRKKLAKKELEKIYDNRFKWLQAGRVLNGRFNNSLEDNPRLKLILKLSLFANVGIWLTVYLVTLKIV
ncbi:MAG: hypothetical protein ACKO47_05135 [Alphaproteobacteria bacterium]